MNCEKCNEIPWLTIFYLGDYDIFVTRAVGVVVAWATAAA